MFGRICNLVVKEFLQLLRDPQARFRLIVPPLIQMIIFGYAATFEVFHVSMPCSISTTARRAGS